MALCCANLTGQHSPTTPALGRGRRTLCLAPKVRRGAQPGFFSNLAFRPQQSKKKGAGSLPHDAKRPTPANHATVEEESDEYFTEQPKSEKAECEEGLQADAKRRRFMDRSDEMLIDERQGVANPELPSDLDDVNHKSTTDVAPEWCQLKFDHFNGTFLRRLQCTLY